MATMNSWFARLLAALVLLLPCATVHASGLFLLDRGSRPMSRGGAFVAGADDPGSLWYNPAGLSESGNQILSDFTLTFMFASFQRMNVNEMGEVVGVSPKVEAKPQLLPIPTLAFSHKFGLKDWTFGGGIFAPNTTLLNWPRSVPGPDGTRLPGPTRYSLIGLKGSILSNLALGLAYGDGEGFSIGADVQLALGRFYAETALSAYDGVACSFPEQSECDAYAKLDVFPAYGITGVFGVKYNIENVIRLGASVMLPYELRGTAKLGLDMPSAAVFQDAYLSGSKADFAMKFPLIVRVGGEIRPVSFLRMEGAFVWEQWSSQKNINVNPSEPIFLRNITGITDYQVGDLKIPRNMKDAWSIRGGYELFIPDRWQLASLKKLKVAIRGGLAYEKGAFSNSAMTPMTLDSDKIVLSAGNSFNIHKKVRLDGTIGYMFMMDPKVRDSAVLQPSSIRPEPNDRTALGNGNYKMDALYIGGGLTVKLD